MATPKPRLVEESMTARHNGRIFYYGFGLQPEYSKANFVLYSLLLPH